MLRKMTQSDLDEVVLIHKKSFDNSHFTHYLNSRKIREFFNLLIKNNNFNYVFITENNEIAGFIIAGFKTQQAINLFIKQNYLALIILVLRHPKFLIEKFSFMLKKTFRIKMFTPTYAVRLFIIAVSEANQNKRVGKLLIDFFERELIKNDITEYGLSVKKNNLKAVHFYYRNNYKVEKELKNSIYFYKKL
jgi:ribosomal protein S18 acetylase RimI-like enzyme